MSEILKFTKMTFLIHFIIGLVFTILYWIPTVSFPLFEMATGPEINTLAMVVGAAMVGLTISSLLGYLAKEWEQVKITVINELLWLIGAILAMLINASVFPVGTLVFQLVTLFALLILFILAFMKQSKK